ncbi:MAG: MFS transporter [Micrococcaceae bacterium]
MSEATLKQPKTNMSNGTKYFINFLVFFTYVLFALLWKAGDYYIAEFPFNASEIALLTNAISFAKIFGSLAAAVVLIRLGQRKAFAVGLSLVIVGVAIVGSMGVFPLIFLIRFIMGLGGAFCVVYMSSVAAKLLEGKALQIMNGINVVAFNVGMVFALIFAKEMKLNIQDSIWIIGAMVVTVLITWLLVTKNLPDNATAADKNAKPYSLKEGFKDRFNQIFAFTYCGMLSYYIVAFTFLPPAVVSWIMLFALVGAALGTVIATFITRKAEFVAFCGLLQIIFASLLIVFANSPLSTVFAILLGLSLNMPTASYAQLAFLRPGVSTNEISVTFSISSSVSYGFSIIAMQAFGFLTDITGGLTPQNTPVSSIPSIFVVFVESMWFFGALGLVYYFRKVAKETVELDDEKEELALESTERLTNV